MAVPKKRRSLMKRRNRKAQDRLDIPGLATCPNCKSAIASHRVCEKCGHYKGKEIVRSGDL